MLLTERISKHIESYQLGLTVILVDVQYALTSLKSKWGLSTRLHCQTGVSAQGIECRSKANEAHYCSLLEALKGSVHPRPGLKMRKLGRVRWSFSVVMSHSPIPDKQILIRGFSHNALHVESAELPLL